MIQGSLFPELDFRLVSPDPVFLAVARRSEINGRISESMTLFHARRRAQAILLARNGTLDLSQPA